jgi:hypothetical protein
VLVLPKEYEVFLKEVEITSKHITTFKTLVELQQFITYFDTEEGKIEVNLSDCRGLLNTTLAGGQEIRELSVLEWKDMPYTVLLFFNGRAWAMANGNTGEDLPPEIGSYYFQNAVLEKKAMINTFESDPAKYSKLLWNCTEEEGWKKVYDLLDIKL